MKIRPLAKADYEEWRVLWVSYLYFYDTSLIFSDITYFACNAIREVFLKYFVEFC